MAFEVKIGQLSDSGKWDKFVKSKDGSNIFQESKWLMLLDKANYLEPCHIQLNQNGNIVGVFPNFRRKQWRGIWQLESTSYGVWRSVMWQTSGRDV